MTESNLTSERVFREIHSDLHREGPGNQASTKRALALAKPLADTCRILDIGCGPGAQTIDLARSLPSASIHAIDFQERFVDETNRRATAAGESDRVHATRGDMRSLAFDNASFDLIWCEAAAYAMGVDNALNAWRTLLRPGGIIAISELAWLKPDPSPEIERYWSQHYPAMTGIDGCREIVRACGYKLLGDFVLPEEAWWEYYEPMQERLRFLTSKYAGDQTARSVLDECAAEIANYRNFGAQYGYVFLVMARIG